MEIIETPPQSKEKGGVEVCNLVSRLKAWVFLLLWGKKRENGKEDAVEVTVLSWLAGFPAR